MPSPDYSSYAKQYAQSRPRYPEELFTHLASLVTQHDVAWDCATGSGQAAISLVKYFKKVIATDISSEQIKNATKHKQIEYKVCEAENSFIDGKSINLVTVASALHWFNLENFYKEVKRVLKLGGVLAAWTYHIGYIEPPFDQLFLHFYKDVLSEYFVKGAELVDDRYSEIKLPGITIETNEYFMSADWNLSNMLSFIESWSGTQQYMKVKGKNPVDLISAELKQVWGAPEKIHTLRWPLFIRISRL
jgi:SAM-dependent methyltransferase